MSSDAVIHLNEDTFDEAIQADKPVLVDFWAEWCGPCRMVGPVLDELAQDYGDKIVVSKVNVDENQDLAGRFGITSIPNIKIFKNGVEVENIVGATPKATLVTAIDRQL